MKLFFFKQKGSNFQTVNLQFDSKTYETFIGSPFLKLTCFGQNLNITDIVWIKYLISNPSSKLVIYSDNSYMLREENDQELQLKAIQSYFYSNNLNLSNDTFVSLASKNLKYYVESSHGYNRTLNASLVIFNIQEADTFYGYECVCNIYKRCSTSNHAKANASLIAIKITTSNLKNANFDQN